MKLEKPKTIFIDIDGTILHHYGDLCKQIEHEPKLLPGVKEKFVKWDRLGYNIIVITGRKESTRKATEEQLRRVGLFYDHLVMGLGGGDRIIINDFKPDSKKPTARAICIKRNVGIGKVKGL